MFRPVLAVIGLVELLAPERLVATAEEIALKNPGECDLEPWVVPAARGEGIFFLFLAWRGNTSYDAFKKSLGVIGLLALLYPRLFVDVAADIAYVDAERCEWKPWCYPLTRLIGLLYMTIALNERRKQ